MGWTLNTRQRKYVKYGAWAIGVVLALPPVYYPIPPYSNTFALMIAIPEAAKINPLIWGIELVAVVWATLYSIHFARND